MVVRGKTERTWGKMVGDGGGKEWLGANSSIFERIDPHCFQCRISTRILMGLIWSFCSLSSLLSGVFVLFCSQIVNFHYLKMQKTVTNELMFNCIWTVRFVSQLAG